MYEVATFFLAAVILTAVVCLASGAALFAFMTPKIVIEIMFEKEIPMLPYIVSILTLAAVIASTLYIWRPQ